MNLLHAPVAEAPGLADVINPSLCPLYRRASWVEGAKPGCHGAEQKIRHHAPGRGLKAFCVGV